LHGKSKGASVLIAAGAIFVAVGLSGCATPPRDDPEAMAAFKETNDPYEPLNRGVFEFNLVLDKAILKPAAFVYKEAVPDTIRNMIRNFLDNLRTPIVLANDVLQGEFERAGTTLIRFAMNSSFGILGIADIAGDMGFQGHDEDFGQTMAVWGVEDGPYLMLPIIGPSNPRDTIGFLVDFLFDPFTYYADTEYRIGRVAMRAVDTRARRYDTINELERTSLDFYAAVRSLHRQRRKDEISNGVTSAQQPAPLMPFSPLNIGDHLAQPKLSMAD
jgi:phospholipid-binding lipoprotein MlaA